MNQWKHKFVTTLAAAPEAWVPLGELFHLVADDLPLHLVLRRAASMERMYRRRRGDDTPVVTDDLDLVSAQWTFFTAFALPLLERQALRKKRAKRTELVRLKANEPCETCAGPTYVMGWVERGAHLKYVCPTCSNGEIPHTPPAVEVPPPVIVAPPPPKLVIVPKSEPPPRTAHVFTDLGAFSSLKEIWNGFAAEASTPEIGLPRFEDNRKLRGMLHRAQEAGAATEYTRLTNYTINELDALGWAGVFAPTPDELKTMTRIIDWRATGWVTEKTPALTKRERDNWARWLILAYRFGAMSLLSITFAGRLPLISDEIDQLIIALEPPVVHRQRAPPQQRWRPSFRKMFRYRIIR